MKLDIPDPILTVETGYEFSDPTAWEIRFYWAEIQVGGMTVMRREYPSDDVDIFDGCGSEERAAELVLADFGRKLHELLEEPFV